MGCAFSWHILSRTVWLCWLCWWSGSIQEGGTKRGWSPEFARGARRCRLALRMLHPPPTLPHQLQPTTAWQPIGLGELKEQSRKVFFVKILDNCIWFSHQIGVLFSFLWHCHLLQHMGQEVMSSHTLSCSAGAQRLHWSHGALGQSRDAINPARGVQRVSEGGLGIWTTLPCPALPIAHPDFAAFCSA